MKNHINWREMNREIENRNRRGSAEEFFTLLPVAAALFTAGIICGAAVMSFLAEVLK